MKAYVLAAGYATRLYPLTRDRAKPLLEVGGRPILSRIVASLCDAAAGSGTASLDEIVVVSNARFAPAFEAWAAAEAVPVPLRVIDDGTRVEAERLGAVGDLALALRSAPPGGEFLVAAGDNLLEFDLAGVLRDFHELARREPPGTTRIVVRRASREPGPSRYNEVELDAAGRVLRFREKPAQPRSELAAIALYVFPQRIAARVEEYLAGGGSADAPGHFIEWLVGREPVHASPLRGEWHDIGTPETLEAARRRFSPRDHGAPPR